MAFYDLSKDQRKQMVHSMHQQIISDLEQQSHKHIPVFFSDEDTYIRKSAYIATGRIYSGTFHLQGVILDMLDTFFLSDNEKIRQTVINAAGEIGMIDFSPVEHFMEQGLFDAHHSIRNAVIGSMKKMGEKNPKPVLQFARKYLHHPDKEIRREICHGIELRGRKHPQDILPLLKELQFDKMARVRNTLVHVLGQIAYKKDCLPTVIAELNTWENKALVQDALDEIIDVHDRYKNFSFLTQQQAEHYIQQYYHPSS